MPANLVEDIAAGYTLAGAAASGGRRGRRPLGFAADCGSGGAVDAVAATAGHCAVEGAESRSGKPCKERFFVEHVA